MYGLRENQTMSTENPKPTLKFIVGGGGLRKKPRVKDVLESSSGTRLVRARIRLRVQTIPTLVYEKYLNSHAGR